MKETYENIYKLADSLSVGESLRIIYGRLKQVPKIPPNVQKKCSTCKYCMVHTYTDGQWEMPHVDRVNCYLTTKDIKPDGICEKYELNDTRV